MWINTDGRTFNSPQVAYGSETTAADPTDGGHQSQPDAGGDNDSEAHEDVSGAFTTAVCHVCSALVRLHSTQLLSAGFLLLAFSASIP